MMVRFLDIELKLPDGVYPTPTRCRCKSQANIFVEVKDRKARAFCPVCGRTDFVVLVEDPYCVDVAYADTVICF